MTPHGNLLNFIGKFEMSSTKIKVEFRTSELVF